MNTCSTPMIWSEPAASNMAILSCLTSVVEHSQMTAMHPSSTFERWKALPETPNLMTSLVRSSMVSRPQSFSSFSLIGTFPTNSLDGVAVAGNSCLNWYSLQLYLPSQYCPHVAVHTRLEDKLSSKLVQLVALHESSNKQAECWPAAVITLNRWHTIVQVYAAAISPRQHWRRYATLPNLSQDLYVISGKQVGVPEALVEELASLRFAFAKLLRNYEKQLRHSKTEAQEEFVEFLPRLFHRAIEDRSFQSHFNTLVEEEISLFNIFYLKQLCTIFPEDVR